MSEDLNSVNLVARLTKDGELQYTNTGFAICKMSIAVNRRKKEGENWVDEASFFDVSLFGKRGESLNQYLTKGTQIALQGSLKQERWNQDGVNRSKVTIEADNIQLLGSPKGAGQSQPQGGPPPQKNQGYQSSPGTPHF